MTQPSRDLGPQSGVTLVELLVVVAIVSVLAIGATLSVGRGQSSAESDAALLTGQLGAARDAALRDGSARGLSFAGRRMQMLRRDGAEWQDHGSPVRLRGPVAVLAGRVVPPQIVLLPDGRASAARLRLGAGKARILCAIDGSGGASCAPG